jgi:UDP-N-acetylglucosamine:LPS N-acetylglucosamine transferase
MAEDSTANGSLTSAPSVRAEVLLVCSTGGHLLQLLALRGAWAGFSRVWVTFDKSDARSLLAEEHVVYAHGPTNRNFGLLAVRNLLRNLVGAARLVRVVRPRVVLTTGAGVAVPYAWIGRLLGARVVYVESLTRIERPSLSCRLIAPVASRIYAQWPELPETMPKARYVGSVVSGT